MLGIPSLLLLLTPGFAGTWSGPITIHTPDGREDHGRAILGIGQRDGRLIGSLGDSETNQSTLDAVKSEDSNLSFNFKIQGRTSVPVQLSLKSGHLVGSGHAAVTLDFDLKPTPNVHTLYERVANLDRQFFDAYNARDLKTIKSLFSPGLEFYHDKDGLTGYKENVDGFRSRFKESTRYRRELDTESLEIYPVRNYGAMEIGVHRFYATPPGQKEQLVATAKFVHVWRNQNGKWQITRVVSYDHH